MAVYISEGHRPDDGGKPWKHLSGSCPRLMELDRSGFAKKRVKNVDDKKPIELHVRRRCSICFAEPSPMQVRILPGASGDFAVTPRAARDRPHPPLVPLEGAPAQPGERAQGGGASRC